MCSDWLNCYFKELVDGKIHKLLYSVKLWLLDKVLCCQKFLFDFVVLLSLIFNIFTSSCKLKFDKSQGCIVRFGEGEPNSNTNTGNEIQNPKTFALSVPIFKYKLKGSTHAQYVYMYCTFKYNCTIFSNKLNNLNFLPFNSQDSFSDSPYCLLYNSFDVSLENLKLDQPIMPLFIFFLYSHCLSA